MSPAGSLLEGEIREQPRALQRALTDNAADIRNVANALRCRQVRYALIAARGTSDNAARYAQYLFGDRLGIPVALAAPSLESLYKAGAVPQRDGLAIGISQSGRSPDVVGVVTAAAAAGAPTIAITNDGDSPLARAADYTLELRAGAERSVAATKTYTTSLLVLAALVTEMAPDDDDRADLRRVPSLVQRALDSAFASVEALDLHASASYLLTVGRGYNYATAMEIALKVRELTATVAEGFSTADLLHGPIAAVAPNTPVVVVAARGKARSAVLETADALRARGARPVLIDEGPDADLALPEEVPEWLSPIVAVVPGQVLALRRAAVGGHPIDQPVGLTKVTETL